MGGSQEFLAFLLEQLEQVPQLRARAMFGATGLYADAVFFGIVREDTLYLRVAPAELAQARAQGRAPFRPYPNRAQLSRSYFSVPARVLEDGCELTLWVRRALIAAQARRR